MSRSRFKFDLQDITKTNGKLLNIHHTIIEDGQRKRIKFLRCAFNSTAESFVAIDHRGACFLFNVSRQFYVILPLPEKQISRCSSVKFHPWPQQTQLILGTKDGSLILIDYNVDGHQFTIEDAEIQWKPRPLFEAAATAKIKLETQPYPRGNPIINLSFPASSSPATVASSNRTSAAVVATGSSNAFLSRTSSQFIVHDLVTFEALFHVDAQDCLSLKHTMYLHPFDYVLLGICGDDTIRVWGMEICSATQDHGLDGGGGGGPAINSELRRRFEVIAMREEFLRRRRAEPVTMTLKRRSSSENLIDALKKDTGNGQLTALCCSRDARQVIVATLDSTLIVFATNDGDFTVQLVIRLAQEVFLTKIDFLLSETRDLLLCRTSVGDLVLLTLPGTDEQVGDRKSNVLQRVPFLVAEGNCVDFTIASDHKMFVVQTTMGELDVYSAAFVLRKMETEIIKRNALHEERNKVPLNVTLAQLTNVKREIQSLLPTKRLIAILNEYNEYPQREVVWHSLLKLPQNEEVFCELLRKGDHPCVKDYHKDFPLKSRAALRNLKKVVSCLAFWSPAFAAADFVPHFVFPFLKVHEKNLLFTFEVCATLFVNHGQLLLEFTPLEPFNYLGMIENLIAHYDPKLMEFYMYHQITSKVFAWPIVKSAFAEVLDTAQWLQLWDHLITNTPDFMVFVAVAYNMTQGGVIRRLRTPADIETFFRDQNLIDMKRFLRTAYTLATQCPDTLKPSQYIGRFSPLLAPVYQKFYNYPRVVVDRSVAERERRAAERDELQAKMDAVAMAENRMMEQLERQLTNEEHSKRLAEVERALDEVMVHETLETANKHHMVLLCERERMNRELATAADLSMCLSRKQVQEREVQLERLLRIADKERIGEETDLQLYEERRQIQEVESRVKERLLLAMGKTKPQEARPQPLLLRDKSRTNAGMVSASCGGGGKAGAEGGDSTGRKQSKVVATADAKWKRPPVTTNRDKLIKYGDRFRRNYTGNLDGVG